MVAGTVVEIMLAEAITEIMVAGATAELVVAGAVAEALVAGTVVEIVVVKTATETVTAGAVKLIISLRMPEIKPTTLRRPWHPYLITHWEHLGIHVHT